jgi:hypothetical protein
MDIAKLVPKFEAKRCCTALAVFAVIVSTLIVLQPYVPTQAMSSANIKSVSLSLPSTANLTLVAVNGTKYVLSSSHIATLPSTTAPGGYMPNGASPPFSTNNYTGVSFNTLANLVGGLNSSEVLMVEGSDGYARNFTYSQVVNGNFSAYTDSRTTGNPTLPTKPIVPIIAYYNNSQLIPGESNGGSGPLMVAIVGNDSLVTPGKFWVKWVDKVEILNSAKSVPEFTSVSLVFLFLALTMIVVVSCVWLSRKSPKKLFFHNA